MKNALLTLAAVSFTYLNTAMALSPKPMNDFCSIEANKTKANYYCKCPSTTVDPDWQKHICVRGAGEDSYKAKPSPGNPIQDKAHYDVIVVGSGLAGLSSSVYLTNHKKSVLLLEKSGSFGGLASGAKDDEVDSKGANEEVSYGRGAAYWTRAYNEEQHILSDIGLGGFLKDNPIPEPIDSYLYNGHLYKGVWDEETMDQLPPAFRMFHFQLRYADQKRMIPDQPIEDAESWEGEDKASLILDTMTAKQWLEGMPNDNVQAHIDEMQKKLEVTQAKLAKAKKNKKPTKELRDKVEDLTSLVEDGKKALAAWNKATAAQKPGPTGMQDIVDFLNLYCRSALGTTSDAVSAIAFANFYISEIDTRFTSTSGTGEAALNMVAMLKKRTNLIDMKSHTPAISIENTKDGVTVLYNENHITHAVKASYVVYAGQIGFAPKLIKDLAAKAPLQAKTMSELGYAHYSVHNVVVQGHPYRSSYDTWINTPQSKMSDPTDVILGLWMDSRMLGYNCPADGKSGKSECTYRDFKLNPPLPQGELTIYNPMPLSVNGTGYTAEQVTQSAIAGVAYLNASFGSLGQDPDWRGPLSSNNIVSVTTNRWPFSVHIAKPGHFITEAKILRKPFGNIYFANNNIGTPAFEEALYRGHCAAMNILGQMTGKFTLEKDENGEIWSRCTDYSKQ